MKYLRFVLWTFLALSSCQLSAQTEGTKVSYPTGKRSLIKALSCTPALWKTYETGLEYVQVSAGATFCQQFNDYLLPKPSTNSDQPSNGQWGKKTDGPSKGAIFLGHHYERIHENEIFVQLMSPTSDRQELENEVNEQCIEWKAALPKPEASEKLPEACKGL